MEHDFWHTRWENREIAFHEGEPNSFLVKYLSRLPMERGARIFLPLCGKTRDIAWLLDQGYQVAGAELNETAVRELFEELEAEPEVEKVGRLFRYSAPDLEIFLGDIFELSSDQLGAVQSVYDRAALVALPEPTRVRYTAHLREITALAPQLLVTFQYEQSKMEGPPFSISLEEIERHYGEAFEIEKLETRTVEGGLKGKVEAGESVYLLSPLVR